MQENVPLVVPEINAAMPLHHEGIIANPNCTTAITLMALYPLHQKFRVKRIFASSYQAVSGTGAQAIEELKQQAKAVVNGQAHRARGLSASDRLQRHSARGFLPADSGYTKEEMKLQNEGRQIMHLPGFQGSRHLRARAGFSRAFGGGERRV